MSTVFQPDWFSVAMANTRLLVEGYLTVAPSSMERRQDVHCAICHGDDGIYYGCEWCPGTAWESDEEGQK